MAKYKPRRCFVCFTSRPAYPSKRRECIGAVEWKTGEDKPLDSLPPTVVKMQTIYNVFTKRDAISMFKFNLANGNV